MPFICGWSDMVHLPEEWTTHSDRKMPSGHGTEPIHSIKINAIK